MILNKLIMTNPMLKNTLPFKHWYELQNNEKNWFINRFIYIYSKQYPDSKTTHSLKLLNHQKQLYHTNDNENFLLDNNSLDSPNIFSFFYEEILKNSYLNNYCQRFNHPNFHNLLIKNKDYL